MIDFHSYFNTYKMLLESDETIHKLKEFGKVLKGVRSNGGRLLFFGNGAAASISSHAALDFTKQGNLKSLCFHDPALLTAYANDYGYEKAYQEIIKCHYQAGDFCIFISVSGQSPNIVTAANYCKYEGYPFASFSGRDKGNSLNKVSDLSFWVDSNAYNIVENIHSIWLLSLCDYLIGKSEYEVS